MSVDPVRERRALRTEPIIDATVNPSQPPGHNAATTQRSRGDDWHTRVIGQT